MPTNIQRDTAEAIVNIFETGKVLSDYGNVTLLDRDSGHLTCGRSQTTLASGNLFLLIKAYVQAVGAQYADQLKQYLSRLNATDLSLDQDAGFKDLLRQAGSDPVMRLWLARFNLVFGLVDLSGREIGKCRINLQTR